MCDLDKCTVWYITEREREYVTISSLAWHEKEKKKKKKDNNDDNDFSTSTISHLYQKMTLLAAFIFKQLDLEKCHCLMSMGESCSSV